MKPSSDPSASARNITPRLIAITGAARGIGRAIAEQLARSGHPVAILDINEPGAQLAAQEIGEKFGVPVWSARLDVSDQAQVETVFHRLESERGPVEVLVNNAAITTNVGTTAAMVPSLWDREIAINLSGSFYASRAVLPKMIERKWGRIICLSSAAGIMGGFGQCAYAASKAGVIGLVKTIALENARYGITANAVVPGLVNTDAAAAIREDLRLRIVATVPSKRMAEPMEVASVVEFLAGEGASYVNGAALHVTGGCELFTF